MDLHIPVVGIGASAGGLDAFHEFFSHMPADSGMAFVVILHLPADRKSMLVEILQRWTSMRVVEGQDGAQIVPNRIYVPPPHAVVTLEGNKLGIQQEQQAGLKGPLPRPIDAFFDSLASALGDQAIGIVLSGTGSDGALGLKAIKECGGLTIVQGTDGSAPEYGEMPAGAIATGAVDLVAPIEQIPEQLLRIRGSARTAFGPEDRSDLAIDAARLRICELLRARVGHDFSGYRDKTFLRRVQRRMQVVSAETLQDYIARLEEDHAEVVLLFRDLLIRVTSFFRDEGTFASLEALVMPQLFSGKQADSTVRVWVPGCATGEEAYSLAILLREHMDKMRGVPKVQVFATDIDESAIATARLGRYPKTLLMGLSKKRFDRFFKSFLGGFVIDKEIRDLCTFSTHNLIQDPPFSRMDLVSCRNLLIYMEPHLQAAVIPAFHYSLLPGGILLLGGSETVARHQNLFEAVDKTARIFRRRDGRSPPLSFHSVKPNLGLQRAALEAANLPAAKHVKEAGAAGIPALIPAAGKRSKMTSRLRAATDRSPRSRGSMQLKHDLIATQEQLQSLNEEHQTALQELRSANEELHSVNEEMQSTNEELETSKEELQSVNEELQTVNVQLSENVGELAIRNSDLRNLFDSTEIATIFLDRHLIVRSFTPAITALYSLIPSDVGRSVNNIVSCLDYDRLDEDVASVLETLKPIEGRIARKDLSMHYMMRILPYRELDSTVSGVLVTYVDVSNIVQAEAALREADLRKDVFLATLSHELRNPLAPIRTAARLLETPDLAPPQLARAQAIISRQVTHMSSLLDDLLDVSRITRGAFTLKKQRVDLKTLVEAAVESVQPAMDAKHHSLRVEIPSAAVAAEVDAVRLTQVLTNLLTNAAKYTPPGGLITVGGYVAGSDLILYVRDNGMGIAPGLISQIFDMFSQADAQAAASEGGLGIGLALAKGLVELHGGKITATSGGVGKGSEFVVSLPHHLAIEGSADVDMAGLDSGSPRRILVADDNKDGADSLGMLLELSGHEVFIAHSGTEALRVARDQRPDIIVLDIGMPDLSGYEVAERLRREPWGASMRLIALTGWGQESDKRRAQMAGFDHHCTKPVNPDDLQRLFRTAPTQ